MEHFELISLINAQQNVKEQYNKILLDCLQHINKKIIERSKDGFFNYTHFLGLDLFIKHIRPELISAIIYKLQKAGYKVDMEIMLNDNQKPFNCKFKIDWSCEKMIN